MKPLVDDALRAKLDTWRAMADSMAAKAVPVERPMESMVVSALGVPHEFKGARRENYLVASGNASALAKADAFIAGGARDLYIAGGVGGGKTRLACTIANELHCRRVPVRFVRVPMVLHQLQPGRDADEVQQLEWALFRTRVLVLDDIGAERDMATDYTRRTLLMIYEERGDRGLRTVFTSNKSLEELGQMQDDDRLASRIAGRVDVVRISVPDQRVVRRGRS